MKKIFFILIVILFSINKMSAQSAQKHTVQRAETFENIAQQYGITEAELKKANPNKSICYVGLVLNIPVKAETRQKSRTVTNTDADIEKVSNQVAQTTTSVAETKTPSKKKGHSFWKSLGEAFSTIGNVTVAVAQGLQDTGLSKKTGETGETIAAAADLVNTTRGQESHYYNNAMAEKNVGNEASYGDVQEDGGQGGENNPELQNLYNQLNAVRQQRANNERNFERAKSKKKPGAHGITNEEMQLIHISEQLARQEGEIKEQISIAEGKHAEFLQHRAENRAKHREYEAQRKENLRKHIEIVNAPLHNAAANAARQQNDDIENNPTRYTDTFGVDGTVDLINKNVETETKYGH